MGPLQKESTILKACVLLQDSFTLGLSLVHPLTPKEKFNSLDIAYEGYLMFFDFL